MTNINGLAMKMGFVASLVLLIDCSWNAFHAECSALKVYILNTGLKHMMKV